MCTWRWTCVFYLLSINKMNATRINKKRGCTLKLKEGWILFTEFSVNMSTVLFPWPLILAQKLHFIITFTPPNSIFFLTFHSQSFASFSAQQYSLHVPASDIPIQSILSKQNLNLIKESLLVVQQTMCT